MRKTINTGLYLILFTIFSLGAFAQSGTITGTVSTAEGNRMSGVTVTVQNTTNSTATDSKGEFTINASPGETLIFTSVGYENELVKVGTSNRLDVRMSLRVNDLDEVVVVGYGVQKKSNVTNAITDVNMDALASRPSADVGRGLQGVVPGLSVRIPSGEVGSDPLIRIRGFIGSIAGSSAPLILVDNVEIPSIQLINPNDIESISILKDAASTSIYGAKGAFGVILITTKKGSSTEQNSLSYSGNFSWQDPFKKIDIAGIDGLQYTLDAHRNMNASGAAGGFWRISESSIEKAKEWQEKYGNIVKPTDPLVYGRDWFFDGTDKYGYRIFDPVDRMVRKHAFTQTHNLGLNGRSGKSSYNISMGYLDQNGMMKPAKHDDFTRYTGKANISTEATDFLTVRAGVMFSDWTKRYPNSSNSSGFAADPWLYLYRWSRLFPIGVLENGEEMIDPYTDAKNSLTNTLQNRYNNLNFGFTIDLNKNWNIIADYAYDVRTINTKSALATASYAYTWATIPSLLKDEDGNQIFVDDEGNVVTSGGTPAYYHQQYDYVTKDRSYVSRNNYENQRHTVNAYSTYNYDLNNKNKFKFMLGTNIVAEKWISSYSEKTDLLDADNPELSFAVGKQSASGGTDWSSLVGYFGRVNYAFDDKYLIEGNLRYDATSKFPANMRWRWYPSFSAGWVISREDFMDNIKSVLSYAKVRGSWGSIGDQTVPNSLYLSTMSADEGSWLTSQGDKFFQLTTPNPISEGITWQDIESLDIGADLRFWKNKLGVTFDVFQRKTKDMIIAGQELPATYGASAPQGNYGNLTTRGWELSLDFNHRFQSGIGLSVMANVSDFYTDITKAADWNIPYEDRKIDNTFTTGKRYGDFYGYVTDRLYQADDFVYDDHGDFVQTTIVWEGTGKVTNVLAGPNPVYQTNFEDGGQTLLIKPGDVKFVDVDGDGYITSGKGTFGDPGDRVVIGNTLPRYEYGGRVAVDYKGFDLSVMGQGVGKRTIWGAGSLAIPGYHVKDGGMPEAIAKNYWTPERTDAFYPRAWNLNGANSGFVMQPQTRYALNMAYFRIKNITLGYNIPANALNRIKIKQARVYVSIENPVTWDHLRGLPIDPEAISGESMLLTNGNYNLGRTGQSNPTFKIYSLGVNISL